MDGVRTEESEEEKINYRSEKMEEDAKDGDLFSYFKTLLQYFLTKSSLKFQLYWKTLKRPAGLRSEANDKSLKPTVCVTFCIFFTNKLII